MYDDAKVRAFSDWHELLVRSEERMDAQEQYNELIRLAVYFRKEGIIDLQERQALIAVATVAYARAVATEP
ncbi:hypothetical protein [Pseudomonas sp. NFIX28]|jgi:hypothetical protein|uniref:hypothetical protein n=1 Tax=Pseudomonas sp. NFIX28 TaxID=1566235 RepID=UPI0008949FD2|nr:hypothetical protein [Pseudomonas sp. NFIX28]SDY32028.1 hypothetical protein SAMN03159453_00213 [Pseudomonas sp. NFIX28]